MSNKVKGISIKNHTYFFLGDIINIKSFDTNSIKINEKSYKNILNCYIRYVTIKDLKYVKINSVNPLCLIFSKENRCFVEINKNNCLVLVPTNESKEITKRHEELWSKIRKLIMSITKNSNDCDDKYRKIKFDLDDDLHLNKMIEIYNVAIVIIDISYENYKYYPQVF